MFSLAMQGIKRDEVAGEAELAEQRLGGRGLVGLIDPAWVILSYAA